MRLALRRHPDSACLAVTGIEAEVKRPDRASLVLSYTVTGTIGDVRMPPMTTAARTDELWRHTCFEAFVRPSGSPAYYEFNFSPSTQWAAYRFDDYREGMRVATEISVPRIAVQSAPDRYALQVALDLPHLPALPGTAVWRLGLSAVIEEANGHISYWALTHPPDRPDFHHPDCFASELPPA